MNTENHIQYLQEKSLQIRETRLQFHQAIEAHQFEEAFRLDGLLELRNASFFHTLHEMTAGERQDNRMVLQRIFQDLNSTDFVESDTFKTNEISYQLWKIDPLLKNTLSTEETEELVIERMREAGLFLWYEHPVEEENEPV